MLGKLLQGRYRITQILSAGGFCQTYLAEDVSLANSPTCVVKHLVTKSDQEESVETLRELLTREAEALEKLGNYDHVPRLLAHFEENREFYLVQEFIPGQTLSAELEPGVRWSESAVVELLQEVLSILEYVHSQGLIHRDLKPSNLIRRYPDHKIVLVDFGSVKQVWTQVVTNQGQTSTSFSLGMPATIAIGTPGYMPSEQARGRPRPNSDIYALGIIGIQALTGLNPRQLLEDTDTGELMWQHNVPVSPALASVLTKMTRYHFQERYESATDALQALQALEPLFKRHALQERQPHNQSSTPEALQRSPTVVAVHKPTNSRRQNKKVNPLGIKTLPQKSTLVIGIATSFAAALVVILGSYYFLRSPGLMPAVKSPVTIGSKDAVVGTSVNNTLLGHSDSVWSVTLSSDGKTLVSGSEDRTIKIWNLDTRQLIRTLYGHSDTVRSVALSSDGQLIASGSGDNTIKLWNLTTGEQLQTLYGHSGTVWSVAISPDGKRLVSGSEDNTVKVWDLPTGKLLYTLKDHSSPVFSVAISPNGQTFASASGDQTIKIWDLGTGKLIRTLDGHGGAVRAVVFSSDGQKLASSSWDKTIKVWNLQGQVIRKFRGHSDRTISVAFTSDGQIVSASVDKTLKIWNLQTGLVRTLTGHSDWVLSVATSPTGRTIVSGSKDKTIKIW